MRKLLVAAFVVAAAACSYTIPPTVLRGILYTKPAPDGGVEFEAVITSAGPAGSTADASAPTADASAPDAQPVADASAPPADSGVTPDSGTVVADAGSAQPDASVPPSPTGPSGLGFNLDFIYSGGEFTFADKMRQARGWLSNTSSSFDDGRLIPVDAAGYPTALTAGQSALAIVPTHGLAERFVVTWQGAGSVAVQDVSVVSTSAGRIVASNAAGNMNMLVRISSLPVSNLQVRRENVPATAVWDPEFLASLQGVKIVRTMQWGLANGDGPANPNNETNWPDRKSDVTLFQRPKVGWGWHVAAANAVDADLWICIPHKATEDYARQLGALVAANLSSSHKVYVEYSNETWNGSFPQNAYTIQQGLAAGLGGGNQWYGGEMWKARRALQLWQAFEAGFGNQDRVVRVLAGQGGWEAMYDRMFQEIGAGQAEAIAMAPYFGPVIRSGDAATLRTGGVDYVMSRVTQHIDASDGLFFELDAFARIAQRHNVAMLAYEGGQHLVLEAGALADDTQLHGILVQAQSDPRMAAAYQRVLAKWSAIGGGVFVHYTLSGVWNRWGFWGACPRNDQCSTSTKYKALIDWRNGL